MVHSLLALEEGEDHDFGVSDDAKERRFANCH